MLLISFIYYNEKSKLIEANNERFFSQLKDLITIIDDQRRFQEEKVQQALNAFEKIITDKGGIKESDSLIDFTYIDPINESKKVAKIKELYLGDRRLQEDTLLLDQIQIYTGSVLTIEQFIPTVGLTTINTTPIPALNNIRTMGSVTTHKPILDAVNNNSTYIGTLIGSISKKIITTAAKSLSTDKGSKVVLYAFDLLEEDKNIKQNIIAKKYLENGFTYLMNRAGVILFHPSAKAIGADMSKIQSVYEPMIGNMNEASKLFYIDQYGIPKYQYFQYYAPFDVFVCIVIPEDDVLNKPLASLRNLLIIGAIVSIIICNLFIVLLANTFSTKPTKNILQKIGALAQGKPLKIEEINQKDEHGQIFTAMNQLIERINNASTFAKEVGKGNFEATLNLNEEDELGKALIEMRDDLKEASEQDAKRRWIGEGVTKFNETIRLYSHQIHELTFKVLSELIKYVNANQGAIFLIAEDEQREACLELSACYAYNRRKYIKQKVYMGEGLIGQTWQEGEEIYLKKIPENYIKISSGLGDALPSALFIVPMKFNEEIQGILEIASFSQFDENQREFILKVVELLSAAISVARFNENTKKLLQESQYMMENLRSQEEEMRQNYEELQATQEEMHRREVESKIEKEELITKIKELQK